jgi:hypothetical protein
MGALQLDQPFLDDHPLLNDDGVNWCPAPKRWSTLVDLGSPGAANPLCTTIDHDGDGQTIALGDCDDTDPTVYLGAPETDAAVDHDCDGVAELGPTAVAALGTGSDAKRCGVLVLDGTASSDPDGPDPLSYAWTLATAPLASARSTADIVGADQATATFEPDVGGDYRFDLVVRDAGGAGSVPAHLDVHVSARTQNDVPVAEAGGNQLLEDTASCTQVGTDWVCDSCADATFQLDGSASSDANGDSLTYAWTLTSGWALLDDATSVTPVVTVSGAEPVAQGDVQVRTIFVSLVVTDCMGDDSDADVMAITYSCTGD